MAGTEKLALRCHVTVALWFRPLLRIGALAARLRLLTIDADRFATWCLRHNAVRVRVETTA